ncbi:MAG: RNA polymerase sigma factor, partial [Actinomycetota bacterium]|nr:RNA polymerase sigma factor [Actinomycetota bacterium]
MSSFEQLYLGHRADVYRAALRDLGNVQDAEDVTQAAFVDAYRAVLRGTRPQAPRAWLLMIAENVRRRRFRTSLHRPREEPLDPEAAPAAEVSHDHAGALLEALETLTTDQRQAFLLREITGLSYEEIADRTGSTVGSVQMLLFRARRALRHELDPPNVNGALLPLASLFSRFEALRGAPRVAGAIGAAALAVGV